MAENSKIAWCDHTFNPWIGCTKVSTGCNNCYAERDNKRRKWAPEGWGRGKARKRTSAKYWREPFKWNRNACKAGIRPRIFCGSLCDIFDPEVPQAWRDLLWGVIGQTPQLDWLLLTKRIENANAMLWPPTAGEAFPPHLWLGITAENQEAYDERVGLLMQIQAAVRWVSYEPAVGPLLLRDPVDWVICGGESGPHARPMSADWPRSVRDQCQRAGIAFFYKQEMQHGTMIHLPKLDGRQWMEFPGLERKA